MCSLSPQAGKDHPLSARAFKWPILGCFKAIIVSHDVPLKTNKAARENVGPIVFWRAQTQRDLRSSMVSCSCRRCDSETKPGEAIALHTQTLASTFLRTLSVDNAGLPHLALHQRAHSASIFVVPAHLPRICHQPNHSHQYWTCPSIAAQREFEFLRVTFDPGSRVFSRLYLFFFYSKNAWVEAKEPDVEVPRQKVTRVRTRVLAMESRTLASRVVRHRLPDGSQSADFSTSELISASNPIPACSVHVCEKAMARRSHP